MKLDGAKITLLGSSMRESELEQIRKTLVQDLLDATKQANAASEAFHAIMGAIPSGLAHPDGVQRIQNASRALSKARASMMVAHVRLADFLGRRLSSDDLKISDVE
jgi:hypothetical protein